MAHQPIHDQTIFELPTTEVLASFEPDDAPRAHLDPIEQTCDLVALAALALHEPLEPETLVVLLDADSRGQCLLTVTDTDRPDDIISIARFLQQAHEQANDHASGGQATAVALISVRPGAIADPDDGDRRAALEQMLWPLTLADWLVFGQSISRPTATDARPETASTRRRGGAQATHGSTPVRHRRR